MHFIEEFVDCDGRLVPVRNGPRYKLHRSSLQVSSVNFYRRVRLTSLKKAHGSYILGDFQNMDLASYLLPSRLERKVSVVATRHVLAFVEGIWSNSGSEKHTIRDHIT
jgi:hypothetical protein